MTSHLLLSPPALSLSLSGFPFHSFFLPLFFFRLSLLFSFLSYNVSYGTLACLCVHLHGLACLMHVFELELGRDFFAGF